MMGLPGFDPATELQSPRGRLGLNIFWDTHSRVPVKLFFDRNYLSEPAVI